MMAVDPSIQDEITKIKDSDLWVKLLPACRMAVQICSLPMPDLVANFSNSDHSIEIDIIAEMVEGLYSAGERFQAMSRILNASLVRVEQLLGQLGSEMRADGTVVLARKRQ
jgi:hypothetical protein